MQVVIVFSAMSSCDPGNIQDTIKAAKAAGCRVSIVGLAAEVYICRQIVEVGTVLDNIWRLVDMGFLFLSSYLSCFNRFEPCVVSQD